MNASDIIIKCFIITINQVILVVDRHEKSRNGGKLWCVIGEWVFSAKPNSKNMFCCIKE